MSFLNVGFGYFFDEKVRGHLPLRLASCFISNVSTEMSFQPRGASSFSSSKRFVRIRTGAILNVSFVNLFKLFRPGRPCLCYDVATCAMTS